jgi:transcriptional antiterminator RfaH
MMCEPEWVVLRTQVRQEPLATQSVAARGVDSYFPLLERGRSAEPLFPGYLFARVAPGTDDLLRIRSAPGIAYVLPRYAPPVLLPDAFVRALRARAASRTPGFQKGDRVTIRRGPFRWLDAIFDKRLNASGRVRVLLDFVHRSVVVDLHTEDLA